MGMQSDTIKDIFFKDERLVNLKQLAKENKCSFKSTEKFTKQKLELKVFQIFSGRKGKRLRGIITSIEKQVPCVGRMYDFVDYSSRRKKTTTIIELHSTKLNLHQFLIKPKGKLNKFKELFIREEQEFILADEFFSSYELLYNRDKSIKLNLNKEVLELIASRNHIVIEGDEQHLLIYYPNQTIPATELKGEFTFAVQLLSEIIEHQTMMEI